MRVLSQSRSVPAVAVSYPARGFTLVELLVTIAVAAILLMIAVPSFTNIVNTNRLNAAANAMIGALNTTRMAAIQQNTQAQFCGNTAATNTNDALGLACGTTAGEVFVLTATTTGTAATRLAEPPVELGIPSIQIHGSLAAIRFNSQGQGLDPSTNAPHDSTTVPIVDICSTALSTSASNHVQVYMAAGSIISTQPASGACP